MSGDAFSSDLETSNFKIFSGKRNHGALAWKRWRGMEGETEGGGGRKKKGMVKGRGKG